MSDLVLVALIGAVPTTITALATLFETLARNRDAQQRQAVEHRAREDHIPLDRLPVPPPRNPSRRPTILIAGLTATIITVFVAYLLLVPNDDGHVVEVRGAQVWTDTGIDVVVGDVVDISADGRVVHSSQTGDAAGPGGIPGTARKFDTNVINNSNHSALIARIGTGPPFEIGPSHNFSADASGRLQLGVNDGDVTNNGGAFTATIRVEPREESP